MKYLVRMEDLLDKQIKDSCKLALPDGLKELMADISREVLRAQPVNLYGFIADYISALLLTREHLTIASRVCGEVCDNFCHPSLDIELREIGLDEEDIVTAVKAIREFFETGHGKEDKLMLHLINNTDISEYQLPSVAEVVRQAYIRHKQGVLAKMENVPEESINDAARAVKHTMTLYKKTEPTDNCKCLMAQKIQTAYRAYKVRKSISKETIELPDEHMESLTSGRSIKFDSIVDYNTTSANANLQTDHSSSSSFSEIEKKHVKTVSSASLAGSWLTLHRRKPYSAVDHDREEKQERVHIYNDYLNEKDEEKNDERNHSQNQISFNNVNEIIDDVANFADDDSVGSIPDESKLAYNEEQESKNHEAEYDNLNTEQIEEVILDSNISEVPEIKITSASEMEGDKKDSNSGSIHSKEETADINETNESATRYTEAEINLDKNDSDNDSINSMNNTFDINERQENDTRDYENETDDKKVNDQVDTLDLEEDVPKLVDSRSSSRSIISNSVGIVKVIEKAPVLDNLIDDEFISH